MQEYIIIQHLNKNNVLQMMAESLEMCFDFDYHLTNWSSINHLSLAFSFSSELGSSIVLLLSASLHKIYFIYRLLPSQKGFGLLLYYLPVYVRVYTLFTTA